MFDRSYGSIKLYCYIACLLIIFVSGCVKLPPTQANIPKINYQGYDELLSINKLLAYEIGKLPEIQDGVSGDEKLAIEYLVNFSSKYPEEIAMTLNRMCSIENSNTRRYCTPLQAAFWLIEDKKYNDFDKIYVNYDLEALLDLSWNMDFVNLNQKEIDQIVNSLPEDIREIYVRFDYRNKREFTQKIILEHFHNNKLPNLSEKIVQDSIRDNKNKKRWDNFDVAIERLNSPEIVNYFEGRFFTPTGARKKSRVFCPTNRYFYQNKIGNPENYASFAVLCLARAGYDAKVIKVYPDHSVCTFKDLDGKEYILDQSNLACTYGDGILDKDLYLKNRPQTN